MDFSIGRIGFRFESDNYAASEIIPAYRPFMVEGGTPDAVLHIHPDRLKVITPRGDIFATDIWFMQRIEAGLAVSMYSPAPDSSVFARMIIDSDLRQGDVYFDPDSEFVPSYPISPPFDQLLMIMLLAQGRGALFHACGIIDGEHGYLCAGNSTHGKTTMARLWQDGATILNDDRIVLREHDGRIWMYGTPWHGELDVVSPCRAPVDKVFFLSHAEANHAAPKTGVEAAAKLLARSFPPFWDQAGLEFTTDFCGQVATRVPCFDLGFVPNQDVIDFIRNA